jgi:phosphomannomutase
LFVDRGTFIEFRNGMLNVSPIGRNCSTEERAEFEIFDKTALVRKKMILDLSTEFEDFNLKYSIGGMISFDVFPIGWDKTFCLRFLEAENYDEIHFFGDKCYEGGNDFEIYSDEKVIGHAIQDPKETIRELKVTFDL